MDNDRLFYAMLQDKQCLCKNKGIAVYTWFMDLNEQSMFNSFPGDRDVYAFTFGGYDGAERKIGVFMPKSYCVTQENFLEYAGGSPLCALRINKDKFSALTHRDYLGALMNLGIKRETLGDIIVDDTGAYVIAYDTAARYIKENLFKIGRGSCSVNEALLSDISCTQGEYRDVFLSLPSMRLDNVVSAVFSVSRKVATAHIVTGKVFVNDVLIQKPDFRVPPGAKVVLRGKGKAMLMQQKGTSKKGREQIVVRLF